MQWQEMWNWIEKYFDDTSSVLQYYMGGSSKFITILHGGGLPNLLQYYNGGGGLSGP